jgi:DNA-binding Lrp family transcriptional regulator
MNLDSTDIKILHALQENGRLSFRQIAEKVKVSVPTVSSKVSNLENMGIIKGYSAELDAEKLGGGSHIIEVFCKPSDIIKLGDRLKTLESVRRAYQLSNGRLLLVCTFPSLGAFNAFIRFISEIPELNSYETSTLVTVIKDETRALIEADGKVVLECAYCHKVMHDAGRKVRLGDKEYFICCPVCEKGLEEKYAAMLSKVHA